MSTRSGDAVPLRRHILPLSIVPFLVAVSCGARREPATFVLPPDFGPVAWTTSPDDVVRDRRIGVSVVWIGRIVHFTVTPHDDTLVLEWTCDSLPFAHPGPAVLRQHPIEVRGQRNGRFLVKLVEVAMPLDTAQALLREYDASPYFMLVAGTVDSIVERDGMPIVFLYAEAFEHSRTRLTDSRSP